MKALSKATTAAMTALLRGVRYHRGKIDSLQKIAEVIKMDKNIP